MRLVAAGDEGAFEWLYVRHAGPALHFAHVILRDVKLAEDVVQEAFVDLWRQANGFDEARCSVRGWIQTLVHRRAVDCVRWNRSRHTSRLDDRFDDVDPDARDPLVAAVTASLGEQAVRAMGQLPEAQCRALVLAYWGGYTMQEIAILEAAPVGTVKSRVLVGLRSLRRAFDEHVDTPVAGVSGGHAGMRQASG